VTSSPLPRLVVDTNIFVPATIGAAASPPGTSAGAGLLRGWRAGFCSLVVSEELLAEYLDVLQRAPFNISSGRATRLIDNVARRAIVVTPKASKRILTKDPDDDVVLKAALAGKAEFLVTDNRRDFDELAATPGKRARGAELSHRGIRIVGLSECLDAIRATHAGAGRVMRKPSRWP
jgi:predicted nucleic acid-binding protein